MTLFDFEYPSVESALGVEYPSIESVAKIDIIKLRAEIIGFRIVWKERKRENREFLRNKLAHLKRMKREYRFEYSSAHELATACV